MTTGVCADDVDGTRLEDGFPGSVLFVWGAASVDVDDLEVGLAAEGTGIDALVEVVGT